MTSIGFRAPGTYVPPAVPRVLPPRADDRPLARRPVAPPTTTSWARLGRVELRSARRYLAVWSVVMFVVLLSVMVLTYALLAALGVLGSVSQALALVSDEAPSSGLVPVLQPQNALPMLVLFSFVLSALFFVAAFGALLVHNATTALTGGISVRIREPRH